MKFKQIVPIIILSASYFNAAAQNAKTDSIQVSKTLHELFAICKSVDFTDPKVASLGTYYKAAPYIIYRGVNKIRNWKDFANYDNADEKKRVNDVCERINRTANQDSSFRIIKYFTETESEGTWHVLMVTYKRKGIDKTAAFAFLKIGNKFGLGDID